MRLLQSQCLGADVTDLDEIRVWLRNVPSSTIAGVVDKKTILGGCNVVKPQHAKILPDGLRSIAEVLSGPTSLAVDQVLAAIGGGPEGIDEWKHAGFQIGNRSTTHRGINSRHQALAGAVIGHSRELAQGQALLKSFVVPEDKHLIFLDGTSQRSSKLIALERRSAGGLIEEVPGVEGAIAQKLEGAAVPFVGPRGGHDADLTSGPFAVLGAVGVLEDVIFPHRIHSQQLPPSPRRRNEKAGRVSADVVDPINHKPVRFRPFASYGKSCPAVVERVRAAVRYTGVQCQELIETPPIQGKVLDL